MVPKSYNHFSEEDARWVGGGGVGGATGGANTNKWHTFAEVRRGVGNRKPCLPLESSPAFPAPRASGGLNPGVMGMQTPPTLPRLPRPEPSPRVTPGSWSRGTELLPVPGNTRRHQRLPGAQREGGGGGRAGGGAVPRDAVIATGRGLRGLRRRRVRSGPVPSLLLARAPRVAPSSPLPASGTVGPGGGSGWGWRGGGGGVALVPTRVLPGPCPR